MTATRSHHGSSPRRRGTRHRLDAGGLRVRFIPAQAGNTDCYVDSHHEVPVHPRAGGEHPSARATATMASGSSPRRRGTLDRGPAHAGLVRFIPAQAGNTRPRSRRRCTRPVHPRAGGEHSAHSAQSSARYGSSPRRRGTHLSRGAARQRLGFIPAQAGNTAPIRRRVRRGTVHPRAGGEHRDVAHPHNRVYGSSPRRRGTPQRMEAVGLQLRFIPAQAGNTSDSTPASTTTAVHPRAGGEHIVEASPEQRRFGSSPRRRGTPRAPPARRPAGRFIPAQAGNTATARARSCRSSVHPRAGGEHRRTLLHLTCEYGSSPRRRGTPCVGGGRDIRGRFIPAQAGNTRSRSPLTAAATVHPRAGGEHLDGTAANGSESGSSPRRRGTHALSGARDAG